MGTPITLDRQRWYRGQENGSRLCRVEDRRCCCLGLLSLQIGYEEEEILGITFPHYLPLSEFKFPLLVQDSVRYFWFAGKRQTENTELASEIAQVNDSLALTDQKRESKLIELFAKMGFDLSFEN